MSDEKRLAVRYEVDVSGEVYTASEIIPARTRNLSETGICFDLAVELQEEAVVGVSLFLVTDGIEDPDAEPLNIKAKVMWCSPRDDSGYSAGMRFDDIDPTVKTAILGFLSQL